MEKSSWDLLCLKPRDGESFPMVGGPDTTENFEAQLEHAREWGYGSVLIDLRKAAPAFLDRYPDVEWTTLAQQPIGDHPWIQWYSGQSALDKKHLPKPLEKIFHFEYVDQPIGNEWSLALESPDWNSYFKVNPEGGRPPRLFDPWSRAPQSLNLEKISVAEDRRSGPAPLWSIIIPCYRHEEELENTLRALAAQNVPADFFEVIILEDTDPGKTTRVDFGGDTFGLLRIRCERESSRTWGDQGYRAGSLRNFGARQARGRRLLFLDADILLPTSFMRGLDAEFVENALFQPRRWNLRDRALFARSPSALSRDWDCVFSPHATWEEFQERHDWPRTPDSWKWVSSFCLAVDARSFKRLGGFRESFRGYGYEDLEFGHRWLREGYQLRKFSSDVFHQLDRSGRTEYEGSLERRAMLFAHNRGQLLRWTLDPAVHAWLEGLDSPRESGTLGLP